MILFTAAYIVICVTITFIEWLTHILTEQIAGFV